MNPITISALTTHIVSLFERDETLRDVWLTGEVSNWKQAASGHVYFSLKDSGATVSAVMWRRSAQGHSWLPRAGDQIVAHGYIGVYPERGAYQFYANRIQPAGQGQLYAQFEALKARLLAEGLFDPERKRAIPVQPRRIGVVTSADAAALRDILRVLTLRWPLVDVLVFSTLVQGSEAPAQIVQAIERANAYSERQRTAGNSPLDTLIVARGGGSIEDLWAFNDERVAYAVAASALPVVAGVGHETDTTIIDFVADLRTPTPSAAAAAVVPDRMEMLDRYVGAAQMLQQQGQRAVDLLRQSMMLQETRLQRLHPQRALDRQQQRLDERMRQMSRTMQRLLSAQREQIRAGQLRLDALSPLAVLTRGYSIVQKGDGQIVSAPGDVAIEERLNVRTAGGEYAVRVAGDK